MRILLLLSLIGCSSSPPVPTCEAFCTSEVAACGSLDAPLPGNPRDPTGNQLFQFRSVESRIGRCMLSFTAEALACRMDVVERIVDAESARRLCRDTGTPGFDDGRPCP